MQAFCIDGGIDVNALYNPSVLHNKGNVKAMQEDLALLPSIST